MLILIWALPAARAICLYCTGISHGPVSASITNAKIDQVTHIYAT